MRKLFGIGLCLILLTGCEPSVPREDLGTLLKDVPKVPGTEKPYKMPELDRSIGETEPTTQSDSTS